MHELIFAVVFFLPAGLANVVPPLLVRIPHLKNWNTPLDFGASWRGKRVFGDNKTWRGLVIGTFVGALTGALIYLVYPSFINEIEIVPTLPLLDMLVIGALLGFGALAGDAIESFFKRRANVAPGKTWFPFDQTDYIIGGLVAVWPVVQLSFLQYVTIGLVWVCLHLITNYIGFKIGVNERPI